MKNMKNRLIIMALLLIAVVNMNAQNENLVLTFDNAEITTDGMLDFYEVDILATKMATSPDFKLGSGLIYIDYSEAAFGSGINDVQVDFEYPTGSILAQEADAFPAAVYGQQVINSNDMDTVALVWLQSYASSTFALDNVTGVTRVLGHLKIEMMNTAVLPEICFNVSGPGFDDQLASACGPDVSEGGSPFTLADCSSFPGVDILDYEGVDCTGAVIPLEVCVGGDTLWNGTVWSNGLPSTTKRAIIDGLYITANQLDLDVCELTITANGSLFISALGSVVVQNNVINEGVFVIEHTANFVQVNDDATVTNTLGTINVDVRTALVETRDFVMLGSPMSQEAREDVWSAAFNVQAFDPALFEPFVPIEVGATYNFQSADFDAWSPKTGVLNAGEGYLVFPQTGYTAPGGQFDYVYDAGTLNNGLYARTLTYDGTPEGSPNMLSNPYASAIDANVFMAANAEIDAVYFWEHGATSSPLTEGPGDRNYSMRDVSAYNGMGGVQAASGAGTTPNGVISTAQGFGVFASAAGIATFNNSMRLTSGNTTIRTSEVQKDRLWLRVQDLSYGEASNALVGFTSTATEGVDAKYDSQVIENAVSLYSYIDEDYSTAYTIQGREEFSIGATVQLGFNTVIEEELDYSISLSDFDGAAWEQAYVYLVDNETGVVTNLHIEDYSFTATEGTYENRFLLRFQHRVLGTGAAALSNVSVYPNPTSRFLNISSPDSMIKSVSIVDLRGRTVMDLNDIVDTNTSIDVSLLSSAVYFAKIQTELGVAEIKFIRE